MKKITLIIALLCSISAFSGTRYLVELGTGGAASWHSAGANEANVNLNSLGVTLNAWVTDRNLAAPTLGGGVSFAANDEIWIAGGIYTVSGVISLKADLSIYGSFAGTETAASQRLKNSTTAWDFTSQTVIDGNSGNYRGVTTNPSVTSCIIDGVQIKNFAITTGTATGVGAYLQANCTMQNCIVSNNSYIGTTSNSCKGVGVQLKSATVLSVKLLDSYIHHNTNTTGAGSGATGGGVAIWGSATVKGCTIESNSATSQGGGVVLTGDFSASTMNSGGNVENCIIRYNSAGNYGSAIACQSTGFKTENVTLKNCQIIENTSALYATVHFTPISTVAVSIEGCLFSGNTVSGNSSSNGYGAALHLLTGDYTTYPIKNCIFRDNSATTTTAATNYGGIFNTDVIATMQNCVFANNTVGTSTVTGISIAKFKIAGSKIFNCTFAKNLMLGTTSSGRALNLNSLAQTVTNCLFWGNYSSNLTNGTSHIGAIGTSTNAPTITYVAQDGGTAPTGTGNIITLASGSNGTGSNNTFVSPVSLQGASTDATTKAQVAAADWRLMTGCPAIDNGTDLASSGVTTDILGNARPTGASVVDMGAYEFGYNTTITFNVGGTVNSYSNGSVDYKPKGTQMAFLITPNHGMGIQSIQYNGTEVKNSLTNLLGSSYYYGGTYTAPALSDNSTLVITFEIDPTTKVNNIQNDFKFINTHGGITIEGLQSAENVSVYGITGNLVASKKTNTNSVTVRLPNGIYLVRVANATYKVIVN